MTALRLSGYFEGALRQAIHRLKFENERYLASHLGAIMADTWRAAPLPVDALVPVPLGVEREAARGYNQSVLLAREAGRLLDLPVAAGALRRLRETPPQMGLPRDQRLDNLRDAFACETSELSGSVACLVDDVTTTGATLAACAATLRQAGAVKVYALVLAKTR